LDSKDEIVGDWIELYNDSHGPGLHSQSYVEQIQFGICLLLFISEYFLFSSPNLDTKIIGCTKLVLLDLFNG
jgi:hypothetical protein